MTFYELNDVMSLCRLSMKRPQYQHIN